MNPGAADQPVTLATLIAPLSVEAFFDEYWPRRFFVHHGELARFQAVAEIPELQDIGAVVRAFRARPDLLQTWLPQGDVRYTRTGALSDALADYGRGARLQFNRVELCVPALKASLDRIERDLTLPLGAVTATLVASTKGALAEPHFDNYPAFTIHLRGTKRWLVDAKREACPNTLDSFVLGYSDVDRIRRFYDGELPTEMPADAEVVDMRPGSVLYMPRGVLHTVDSNEHALALAIDCVIPSWADVIGRDLTARLNRSVEWRGFALGLGPGADSQRRRAAREQLTLLLAELPRVIKQLQESPDEVLDTASPPLMPGPRRKYRLHPRAQTRLERRREHDEEVWCLFIEHTDHGPSEIEITPELAPFCRWVLEQKDGFLAVDAAYAAQGALQSNLRQLLVALLETGSIEAIEP